MSFRRCLTLSLLLTFCWGCPGTGPAVLSDLPPLPGADEPAPTGGAVDPADTDDAGTSDAASDDAEGNTAVDAGEDDPAESASGGADSGSDTGTDASDDTGDDDSGDDASDGDGAPDDWHRPPGDDDSPGGDDPPGGGDPADPGDSDDPADPPPDISIPAEGATYAASLLTPEQIVAALQAIGDLERRVSETEEEQYASALRRVQAYRFLLGLRTDITLDPNDIALADAAAEICMLLGTLTHNPSRPPGMSDEEYALAKQGAGQSNLATSYPKITIPYSIDMYMDDSDSSNISRLGHRRWIMNPLMSGTGFGLSSDQRYSAMHVFPDAEYASACFNNPTARQEWDMILYPRWGYMPRAYFANSSVAWSISLRGDRYDASGVNAADISVWRADADNNPIGSPLNILYFNVSNDNYGCQHPVVIFRPQGIQVLDGNRYLVSVSGITDLNGDPVPLTYWVEFFTAKITVVQ